MSAAAEGERRRIVVAVDESEESVYALSWCLGNVVVSGDRLVLLYAKPPRALYPTMDGTGYLFSSDIVASMERYGNEVAECVIEKAKRICKEHVAKSGGGDDSVTVETMVQDGDPRDVICQVADRLAVDLLVIGSHGYGAIKRAFLGSVSNHCAQNVKCPIMIVKKPKTMGTH